MQKGLVAILAVAVIGFLGIYSKGHGKSAQTNPVTVPASSAVASDNTSATKTSNTPLSSGLRDGTYTGSTAQVSYGPVQIAIVISGGKIADINFLQMPNDLGYSQEVTAVAGPILKQETLQSQSANIDFVSGATSTSSGYEQSLQSALDQAKLS